MSSVVKKKSFSSWLKIDYSDEHNQIQTHTNSQSHTTPPSNIPLNNLQAGKALQALKYTPDLILWDPYSVFFKNKL